MAKRAALSIEIYDPRDGRAVYLTTRELSLLAAARDRYTPDQLIEYLHGATAMNDMPSMQLPLELQ